MESSEWTTVTLTHVIYPKGDFFGHILAYFSLVPFCIIVAFFTLTVINRDLNVIFFFFGQLGNELINFILKRIIRQPRPVQILNEPHSNPAYGMPSSHCQFQTFFSIYTILYVGVYLKKKPRLLQVLILNSLAISFSTVVLSRTYLLYHTWSQCLVGIFTGGILGLTWFYIFKKFSRSLFNFILSFKISKHLGFCDDFGTMIKRS